MYALRYIVASKFHSFVLCLRISFEIIDSWGYRIENGSWSGMIGMLERREIDIGGTATFLVSERLGVVQYIQLYTQTR